MGNACASNCSGRAGHSIESECKYIAFDPKVEDDELCNTFRRISLYPPSQALGTEINVTDPCNPLDEEDILLAYTSGDRRMIVKIQSAFRGFSTRRRLKDGFLDTLSHSSKRLEQVHEQEVNLNNRDSAVYSGQVRVSGGSTLRQGFGIMRWHDGSVYEGLWADNLYSGRGKLHHASGDLYEGEFSNDMANGFGVYKQANGQKYVGYWKNDKFDGFGRETWTDGSSYQGFYRHSIKQGQGEYIWNDGNRFLGEWQDNKMHGMGLFQWQDGKLYIGEWRDNFMEGEGFFITKDHKAYLGDFKRDSKSGNGIYLWPEGKAYNGQWEKGKQHGVGFFIARNSNASDTQLVIRKGVWLNGKRLSWFDEDITSQEKQEQYFAYNKILDRVQCLQTEMKALEDTLEQLAYRQLGEKKNYDSILNDLEQPTDLEELTAEQPLETLIKEALNYDSVTYRNALGIPQQDEHEEDEEEKVECPSDDIGVSRPPSQSGQGPVLLSTAQTIDFHPVEEKLDESEESEKEEPFVNPILQFIRQHIETACRLASCSRKLTKKALRVKQTGQTDFEMLGTRFTIMRPPLYMINEEFDVSKVFVKSGVVTQPIKEFLQTQILEQNKKEKEVALPAPTQVHLLGTSKTIPAKNLLRSSVTLSGQSSPRLKLKSPTPSIKHSQQSGPLNLKSMGHTTPQGVDDGRQSLHSDMRHHDAGQHTPLSQFKDEGYNSLQEYQTKGTKNTRYEQNVREHSKIDGPIFSDISMPTNSIDNRGTMGRPLGGVDSLVMPSKDATSPGLDKFQGAFLLELKDKFNFDKLQSLQPSELSSEQATGGKKGTSQNKTQNPLDEEFDAKDLRDSEVQQPSERKFTSRLNLDKISPAPSTIEQQLAVKRIRQRLGEGVSNLMAPTNNQKRAASTAKNSPRLGGSTIDPARYASKSDL